nr:MAG TPA: hypothetical protein [Caudoviricetes sp.]
MNNFSNILNLKHIHDKIIYIKGGEYNCESKH